MVVHVSTEPTGGRYNKAIVAAIAGAVLGAIGVLTGAMTAQDTFGDVPTVTWLYALAAAIAGSGLTGGTVAISKANATRSTLTTVASAASEPDPYRGERPPRDMVV